MKKDKAVFVRLSAAEKLKLAKLSKGAGMTLSGFICFLINFYEGLLKKLDK